MRNKESQAGKPEYLRKVTTPFVPENIDDSCMIQKLSVAAARIIEQGSEPGGASQAELQDEEDLFVAALAELNAYFSGVACAAKAFTKHNNNQQTTDNQQQNDNDDEQQLIQGRLQPIAARVLMKVLYGARLARFDLLRVVCYLATFKTK